jgi:hypothetical protein
MLCNNENCVSSAQSPAFCGIRSSNDLVLSQISQKNYCISLFRVLQTLSSFSIFSLEAVYYRFLDNEELQEQE